MGYLYLKALHIIFVVTWFSGMFYTVRLFIYLREAQDKKADEKQILTPQFLLMSKRLLYGITWPSAIITLGFGLSLLTYFGTYPLWLILKLSLLVLLFLYQWSIQVIYNQQSNGLYKYNSQQLRLWNEVPTIFLVAIVMLVVVKQEISLVYGLAGLIALIVVLMSAIKIYKSVRKD